MSKFPPEFYERCKEEAHKIATISSERAWPEDCVNERKQWYARVFNKEYSDRAYPPVNFYNR